MPADGGIVAGVREAAVQRPEAADETRRVLRHRFGEIAAGRRDGPDDRHGTVRPVQIVHIAGPFVETGQTRGKIRRKSFVRRHFLQSAGQLAQGLRPTGRRIRHDGDVVAHVAVELRQRDSRVDRHFARRDRHVGRVRDQNRPLHQRTSCTRIHQFRKLAEDLRHFVAAFAAADVDDDVRVAPFGQRLLRHRLARSETARNGGRAALRDREERVDDAQTRQQRRFQRLARQNGPRRADRPVLIEAQRFRRAVVVFDFRQNRAAVVVAFRFHGFHAAGLERRRRDELQKDGRRLLNFAVLHAGLHDVAFLHGRDEMPDLVQILRIRLLAAADHRARHGRDAVQRPLDAVVNRSKQAWSEFDGQRTRRAIHAFAGLQAGRVLIDLNRRDAAAADADHFADQPFFADFDDFQHARAFHVTSLHNRPVDPRDDTFCHDFRHLIPL